MYYPKWRNILHASFPLPTDRLMTMNALPADSEQFDPALLFPGLRVGVYRLAFEPRSTINLPPYTGSAWRGLLGTAPKHLFCPWEKKACRQCLVQHSCPYYILYEETSHESGFADVPRPYILCPLPEEKGLIGLELTVAGKACEFVPGILAACESAGQIGLGRGRLKFGLKFILQKLPDGSWKEIYGHRESISIEQASWLLADFLDDSQPPPPWKIELVTPMRLRKNGQNLDTPDWSWAFSTLGMRLSMLAYLAGGERFSPEQWSNIKFFLSSPGESNDYVSWYDWKRYSSRQKRHVPMGGLVGSSLVRPPEGAEAVWWRWWQTAHLFHMGKGVTMGLGKIDI